MQKQEIISLRLSLGFSMEDENKLRESKGNEDIKLYVNTKMVVELY
jgi:hypothetical protein